MDRLRIGMRWWLAVAFTIIGFLSALAATQTVTRRAEHSFRERAEAEAVADSRAVAKAIESAVRPDNPQAAARTIAEQRDIAVFLFDRSGRLVTPPESNGTSLRAVPGARGAIEAALAGDSFSRSFDEGAVTVVAVPLRWPRAAALVTQARHPGYAVPMTVLREQALVGLAWGVGFGALVGFAVAALVARRLRRIAVAAQAIERGDFSVELRPRFGDEIGVLAGRIDGMRKRLQESITDLRAERARLMRLLERLDQGVATVDRELNVQVANSAAARLLGVSSLAEGDPLPEPWPDFPLRHFAGQLFEGASAASHARVSVADGRAYTVDGVPAGDAFPTAVLVITDVSDLERRERIEREFVANAAHELRTPLAAIMSAIEVLQGAAKDSPPDRDRFLQIVARQSGRLAQLTNALLVLARAEADAGELELVPVDLCPLLEQVAADLRAGDSVEIDVECADRLRVLAERDLFEHVIANLAENAAKHAAGARITITAREVADDLVSIEVTDTGAGIAGDDRMRVFDRFYRGTDRSREGFGLGLSIVRQVVRALGGAVEIHSPPGEGTTVRVTMPAAALESGAVT
jgi:signal transduction histidine kinase/HAMP domain-containing protein